jgi:hypothetical protein
VTKKYTFQYVREQRVTIQVEAASWEEAEEKAWWETEKLTLWALDDESDDKGSLYRCEE